MVTLLPRPGVQKPCVRTIHKRNTEL